MEKTIVGKHFKNALGDDITDIISKFVPNKTNFEQFFEFCKEMKNVALNRKGQENVYNLIDGSDYHLNNKIVIEGPGLITSSTYFIKFRVTENNAEALTKRAVVVRTRLPAYNQAFVSKFNKKTKIVHLKSIENPKSKVFRVEVSDFIIWAEIRISEETFRNPEEAEEHARKIYEISDNRSINRGNAGK